MLNVQMTKEKKKALTFQQIWSTDYFMQPANGPKPKIWN